MAARAVRTSATDHFAIISGIEKIATDIYSFENLRKGGYVYVDKTDLLWRLASEKEGRQFFISRPRRFGKSLMLSTLKCLFEGRKDLFRGLKIEKRRWAWKTTYPVVMLDMSKAKASTPEALEAVLLGMVLRLARSFKVRLAKTDIVTAGSAFAAFLEGLADKQGGYVVAGGDPPGPREEVCRRLQGRQAPRHARRRQLPHGEAQHRRAAFREALNVLDFSRRYGIYCVAMTKISCDNCEFPQGRLVIISLFRRDCVGLRISRKCAHGKLHSPERDQS